MFTKEDEAVLKRLGLTGATLDWSGKYNLGADCSSNNDLCVYWGVPKQNTSTPLREERDDKVIVTYAVPGAKKEDINVTLEDSTLTITAKSLFGDYYWREYLYDIDSNTAKSTYENGVLRIEFDRKSKTSKINIEVK